MLRLSKKKLLVLVFCLSFCFTAALSFAASGDKGNTPSIQEIQSEVQKTLNEMISITGTIVSGMAAGLQEGAEKAQEQLDGADGTKLIANKKDLVELVQVTVFKLEDQGNGSWRVTLAIRNTNNYPVRLVNLTRKHVVLLLDTGGFAYDPVLQQESARTLTVAARAAVKTSFNFSGLDAEPDTLRLFDADFPVP